MEKGIAEFARLAQEEHTNILRDASKRVKNSLVRLSPVDEGDYVAEWDVAIGHWPTDTEQAPDPKKRTTRARLQAPIDNLDFGENLFFENNDEVAARLEFGYSKQAPQGVVRLTARRWRSFVKGAARAATNRIRKKLVID